MRRIERPTFQYEREPALWAAATATLLGTVAVLVVGRPLLLILAGFVAGVVAASRGGFYSSHSNNGFVGVLLALVPLYPIVLLYRALLLPLALGRSNVVFIAGVAALLDFVFVSVPMLALGFLGGIAGDFVRRRTDGRLGY